MSNKLTCGTSLWVKAGAYPYWPAVCVDHESRYLPPNVLQARPKMNAMALVYFFGWDEAPFYWITAKTKITLTQTKFNPTCQDALVLAMKFEAIRRQDPKHFAKLLQTPQDIGKTLRLAKQPIRHSIQPAEKKTKTLRPSEACRFTCLECDHISHYSCRAQATHCKKCLSTRVESFWCNSCSKTFDWWTIHNHQPNYLDSFSCPACKKKTLGIEF